MALPFPIYPGTGPINSRICKPGSPGIGTHPACQSENKARLLEESDQLKTSLLNSVSHELRSPCHQGIRLQLAQWCSGLDPEAQQDLLLSIEEETDHLNLLVGIYGYVPH